MRIEVRGLSKSFGATRAVDDASFTFSSGEILGFVGPNGAGKTTTMRILATLEEPSGGEILVDGVSVAEEPERARVLVGFVPDFLPAHHDMTVHEYLDFFARAYNLRGTARHQAVDNIIEFMGIGELRDRNVESLSKGLKQRVALGRALVHDPQVLILDEPAANLDPRARIEFRALIRELAADGKTILLSSHILTELAEMCDAIAVIEKGRILATGTVSEILAGMRPRRSLSARFAGATDGLERFLLEQPGVVNVHEAGGRMRFELEGDDDAQAALVGRLIAAGYRVLEFSAHGAGLEDLFIEITQGRVQ